MNLLQRRKIMSASLLVASTALFASCGFKLRGDIAYKYAFQSIFSGFSPNSTLGQEFKRQATTQGLKVVDAAASANSAQVVLRVVQEQRERAVVGSGVAGQVNALQLRVRLKFSLFTTQGKALLEDIEILQQREMSYSESIALAKESEEKLLYNDMQGEVVQQVLRRLAAIQSL